MMTLTIFHRIGLEVVKYANLDYHRNRFTLDQITNHILSNELGAWIKSDEKHEIHYI